MKNDDLSDINLNEDDDDGFFDYDRKPLDLSHLEEGQAHMLLPFAPHITYARIPPAIIKSLNDYTDHMVESEESKNHDNSDNLVGQVAEEFKITPGELNKHMPWFNSVFNIFNDMYMNRRDLVMDENLKTNVVINSSWVVRQFENDFNPAHFHTNCHASAVGYLRLPDDWDAEMEEDYKDHYPCRGHIEFSYDITRRWHDGSVLVKPNVGDFFIFPSYLKHAVYPFRRKGERRSFSMNVKYQLSKK